MRNLIILLFLAFTLSSCDKSQNDIIIANNKSVYEIQDLNFFQSDEDKIDSVFSRLDTIVYVNNTNTTQPEQTFEPYKNLADSLSIELDDSTKQNILIKNNFYFPSIIINNKVLYFSLDSIKIESLSGVYGGHRSILSEKIIPTPKTKYLITGEYYLVKYSVHFTAKVKDTKDNSEYNITGKINGSTITTSYYGGQNESPSSIILIITPLE